MVTPAGGALGVLTGTGVLLVALAWRYSPYRVFIGTTRAEGAVHIGLGETIRENKWGRDRKYVVARRGSC